MDKAYFNMLRRHSYELKIFPILNEFVVNEDVMVEEFGFIEYRSKDFSKGKIIDFNDDGTLYIRMDESDLGRNFSPKYIYKLNNEMITSSLSKLHIVQVKTPSKKILFSDLIRNHSYEFEQFKRFYVLD